MPFYIYSCTQENKSSLRFERKSETSLVGNGLITTAAQKHGYLGKNEYGWRLTAEQILESTGKNRDRIISDIAPDREENQLLASIEFVSGYSYTTWAPLVLHMVEVAGGVLPQKESFACGSGELEVFRSFLYINKRNESWMWGPTGNVNSPLLWEPAMKFFQQENEEIGYKIKIA
ncbi:MAG: hypothetical protein MPK30_08165 [Gammaproteobacteria bacterium]|nr:hypothetical protein [Gammaproteobacteria bacterium]